MSQLICENYTEHGAHSVAYRHKVELHGSPIGQVMYLCTDCFTYYVKHHKLPGEKQMVEFLSGAKRASAEIRYDLLPREGLLRAIAAFVEGEEKYGKNNYQKGIPVQNLLNHAIDHIVKELVGDRTEDHKGHALANLMMACWMDLDLRKGGENIATEEGKKREGD